MLNLTFNAITDAQAIKHATQNMQLGTQNTVFTTAYWFDNSIDENNISFTATDEAGIIQKAFHTKIHTNYGFKIAEMAGEPFTQYNDVVSNDGQPSEQFFEQVLAHLKSIGVDALHLRNVRQDAHIASYCVGKGAILDDKQAPWIDLSQYENYEAYFDKTSKTTRKIYRKFFRDFEVDCNYYTDEQITPDLIQEIMDLKKAQLESYGQTSRVFADEDKLDEISKIFSAPTADFITYAATTRCDGKLVAAAISHIKNDKYYGYIIAMDTDYTKYSPGNSQVLLNIQWAFDNGIKVFDFLAPADDYKFKWTKNNFTPACEVLLPMGLKGKFYGSVYIKRIRPQLKAAYLFIKNSPLFKTLKK